MTDRAAEITLRVTTVLEELQIDYVIGGSLSVPSTGLPCHAGH